MTTATNTTGAIANAAAQAATAPVRKTPAQLMNSILNSDHTKKLLENTLKENAGSFAASVLDLYNTDTYLQKCDPKHVFGECLKAASLKLPINKQLGFAYVVPYKGTPQFQIGYKGLIQLAMRTGAYKYINAGIVYEGEFVGENKLTGDIDISGERTGDDITGYFAYIETTNGFSKALYWTKEKVIAHAMRFSQSYKSGALIWKEHFHEMAQKTVLRNLLSKWGIMSVEMITAVTDDAVADTGSAAAMDEEPITAEFTTTEADENNG
jgi:recombination protein RecT